MVGAKVSKELREGKKVGLRRGVNHSRVSLMLWLTSGVEMPENLTIEAPEWGSYADVSQCLDQWLEFCNGTPSPLRICGLSITSGQI